MHKPSQLFAKLSEPIFLTRLRIGSGLVLFIYVFSHFLNHMLGLWSLELMEAVGQYFRSFWRFPPMSVILYGALLMHVVLALLQLYKKRSLSMSAREWLQIILGLAIPLLMVLHLLGTRMANAFYGLNDNYAYVVMATFVQSPASGIVNAIGLLVVWVHGCIGLHGWLRLKPWFTGNWPALTLVVAASVPVLALNGFVAAGREVTLLAQDGEWLGEFFANLNLTNNNLGQIVGELASIYRYGFVALVVVIVALRIVRQLSTARNNRVEIDYVDGPTVHHPDGSSLLDISRFHNVPHASVCGGRGRCSTCRVRLLSTERQQIPPDAGEQAVLRRVDANDDVRLACQFVPRGKIRVVRLLPADATMQDLGKLTNQSHGVEQVVAIVFADIRGFTAQSETRLPFDVVYLVNQFARAMGQAIEDSGGKVDKFLGDGLMAIFGIDTSPKDGCIAALTAARKMQQALDELNSKLAHDLSEPLRIGIGIHAGPVVLGNMGYGASRGLTAIGDTVNTASRLEAATKEQGVSLCISADVANFAKVEAEPSTSREIVLRGKKHALPAYALDRTELDNLLIDL